MSYRSKYGSTAGGSRSSSSSNGYAGPHCTGSTSTSSSSQRPGSFSSGYGSGYTSPIGHSPTFKFAQSPLQSPTSPLSPCGSPGASAMRLYDVNANQREQTEYERSMEYHQAPDTFPCGHVLCHKCLRRFMTTLNSACGARCPVCRTGVTGSDVSLASLGLPGNEEEADSSISLLSNFDEIVKKFNGIQTTLRRLKDESVQARSMGMTYTNTQCHMCRESHPTLRVIQEHNQLAVRHERPHAWSNYFYRLQHGKVVTTFYSKVSSSTICVPCTYRELQEHKAILPADMQTLPLVDPARNQQLVLAEVGKIVAKSAAPLMMLRGKNVVEVDHKIRVRERADHFNFLETAAQIERNVRRQEEMLLAFATCQVRDTGQMYHVQESHEVEYDMDETTV